MHYDTGRKNVVSEHYDEIVFSDPTNSYIMYNLLNNPKPLVQVIGHEAGVDYKELEESVDVNSQTIKLEIQELSNRLKMSKEIIQKLRDHLKEVEEEDIDDQD